MKQRFVIYFSKAWMIKEVTKHETSWLTAYYYFLSYLL